MRAFSICTSIIVAPTTLAQNSRQQTHSDAGAIPIATALDQTDISLLLKRALELRSQPNGAAQAEQVYRKVLQQDPNNLSARKGLAQVLPLPDRIDEARSLYGALLDEQPHDVELLLGRAQIARADNDKKLARELIEKALLIAPREARLLAESAFLDLQNEDPASARKKLAVARAINPRLPVVQLARQAIENSTTPSGQVSFGGSNDSTGFNINAISARYERFLRPNTRLRLEPGYSSFHDNSSSIHRPRIGLGVRQVLPAGLIGNVVYRANFPEEVDPTYELDAELGWVPFELPISLGVGQRRRAIVDTPFGNEDVGDLGSVGSGGTTVAAVRQRLQISEKIVGFVATPAPGFYVYAEGTKGKFNDSNRRKSVVAGLGLDIFRNEKGLANQSLTFKYDFLDSRFRQSSMQFFSPSVFQIHTPGFDYRYRQDGKYQVGVEAGFPINSNGDTGYLVGGFISVKLLDGLSIEGRARRMDDTQFRITSIVLGPRFAL